MKFLTLARGEASCFPPDASSTEGDTISHHSSVNPKAALSTRTWSSSKKEKPRNSCPPVRGFSTRSTSTTLDSHCVQKRNFAALVVFSCQHGSGKTIRRFGKGEANMLYWALVFLIVALVAAALGFGGIAGASAGIAKILFFIFLVLLLVSLVTHFTRGPRIP